MTVRNVIGNETDKYILFNILTYWIGLLSSKNTKGKPITYESQTPDLNTSSEVEK